MLVTLDNLGQYGVLRDSLPHELPDNAFSDGRNVRFRDGYAEKFLGHSAIYGTAPIAPYHLQPMTVSGVRWWIAAGLAKIYSIDTSGTHTNITRSPGGDYSATADKRWTSTVLGGIAVLNNGVDVPQVWAGTGICTELGNWTSGMTARSVRAFRGFLVAVNITKNSGANKYPHMVKWSSAADPGTVPSSWDESDPTNDAGEYDLADHQSEAVDSMPLGDALMLYKEGAYYALEDTGSQSVFRSRLVSTEVGLLSTNCAANWSGGHVCLGQGDVYIHSGGAPETILTARARRWLFRNLDATYYARSFVAANPLASEAWVCFPEAGATSCNLALVWNWKANTLAIRELPNVAHAAEGVVDASAANSWNSDTDSWSNDATSWNQNETAPTATRLMLADVSTPRVALADSSTSFAGTAMTAYVERTGWSLGRPDQVKLIRSVRPIFEGAGDAEITVEVGASMTPTGTPTWSAPVTFTVGTDVSADTFAAGRFLALRISTASKVAWRLKRFELDVDPVGNY